MNYPKKMYGLVLTGHGGFEKMVWQNDISTPVPASEEVLVRVGASSINNTDVNTRVGGIPRRFAVARPAGRRPDTMLRLKKMQHGPAPP